MRGREREGLALQLYNRDEGEGFCLGRPYSCTTGAREREGPALQLYNMGEGEGGAGLTVEEQG